MIFLIIIGDDEENVTWATDVSEHAVRERMTELSMGVKALAVDDDIEKSEPEKLNILFTFAKKALEKGKNIYPKILCFPMTWVF